MKEIPLTRGKVTLVDDEFYSELSKYKWYAHKADNGCFYAVHTTPRVDEKQTRLRMARVVLELAGFDGTGLVAHHKSHDTLDNRLQNLEFVKQEDNLRDKKSNTTGFAGVHWDKDCRKFRALIKVNGKKHHIGYYDDPYSAALARIAWMEEHNIDTTFSKQQLQQALESQRESTLIQLPLQGV